ncbi:hypothetical protein AX774_g5130 [Zancudomyces culisetae]|uniref:Uncharacterized protein n=1 Tax=Zancudomyces culisetae TaxID=1213189 RepID=A0A1R1PKD4_ZANCU|nr:hypothetical protein AX774_g5130 [Zancudomyces culisetae]|eukprot:OMH81407.1 hypothetical protein AX774_g5130 [Zancudomyces culisetae]
MEEGVKELVVDELCEVGNRWSPQSKVSGQRLLEGLSTEIERSAKASKSIKKKIIFGSPVSANDTFPPLSPLVNKGKLEGLSNKVNRIKDELTKGKIYDSVVLILYYMSACCCVGT